MKTGCFKPLAHSGRATDMQKMMTLFANPKEISRPPKLPSPKLLIIEETSIIKSIMPRYSLKASTLKRITRKLIKSPNRLK